MRSDFLKISLICFIICLVLLAFDYICFHHLTCKGFVKEHQKEAGKPFVTMLIGNFAVAMLAGSVMSLLYALIVCPR